MCCPPHVFRMCLQALHFLYACVCMYVRMYVCISYVFPSIILPNCVVRVYFRMFVCMHACTYVCMHACMYACMSEYHIACGQKFISTYESFSRLHVYVCMVVCVYVCIHVFMFACMQKIIPACESTSRLHMYVCVYVCVYVCIFGCYISVCQCVYACVCMYACIPFMCIFKHLNLWLQICASECQANNNLHVRVYV